MVYFGFFITQISFSHFMQIIHNIIEDEIYYYSVGLGHKMAPRLIKEINFTVS